jgi:hypothetical protein
MHVLSPSIVSDWCRLQSPLHDDGISVVYSVTTVPLGKVAAQLVQQSMPAGLLVHCTSL